MYLYRSSKLWPTDQIIKMNLALQLSFLTSELECRYNRGGKVDGDVDRGPGLESGRPESKSILGHLLVLWPWGSHCRCIICNMCRREKLKNYSNNFTMKSPEGLTKRQTQLKSNKNNNKGRKTQSNIKLNSIHLLIDSHAPGIVLRARDITEKLKKILPSKRFQFNGIYCLYESKYAR